MKKLLLLGILALSTTACMAYVYEDQTATVEAIKASGYSNEIAEIVDMANYTNKGINSNYVRYFKPKQPKNPIAKAYTAAKKYWDPIQDDGRFGLHDFEFSNTWNGDRTHYSSELAAPSEVDNL